MIFASAVGLAALTITMGLLIWALVSRDFRFEYVAQYVSRLLPWRYSLSALWVGQAGSLLLWTWMTAVIAILLRLLPTADIQLRNTAFGLVMANVFFLVVVMVFAADPMAPSLIAANQGAGLSPLLQDPSMLIHPPIVFLAYSVWAVPCALALPPHRTLDTTWTCLAYSVWAVPCALALAALTIGPLDTTWTHMARPWALSAWTLLGVGLLLGAHWAYHELGWGGYWGWDPVENGSLLPWLTGTAHHSQHDGVASTRGIKENRDFARDYHFRPVQFRHVSNAQRHLQQRSRVQRITDRLDVPWPNVRAPGLWHDNVSSSAQHARWSTIDTHLARARTLIVVSIFLLLSLTVVVLVGTLIGPLSKMLIGRTIQVGPEFYNNVLPPIGLGLLAMTSIVPLLQWGAAPNSNARRLLMIGLLVSFVGVVAALAVGLRHPLALAVAALVTLAITVLVMAFFDDALRREGHIGWRNLLSVLRKGRHKYAAYCIHLGFVCVAMGVAGSSLGTQRQEVTLDEGAVIDWAGQRIRYVRLEQRQLPDKLVAEAVLELDRGRSTPIELRPARHLHLLQNEWTTEVAIYSTWWGDLYTVLDAGLGNGKIALTLVNNPMIRWIWAGGALTTLSAVVAIWPSRRSRQAAAITSHTSSAEVVVNGDEKHASAA